MNIKLLKQSAVSAIKKSILGNFFLYCVIVLLILKIFTAGIFFGFSKNLFFADITKATLVQLVNQERESAGLNLLSENDKLDWAAYFKAEDMIKNQYFNHTSPSGVTPWYWFKKAGYNYKLAGENLAIGFYDSKEAIDAWLASPSHRQNLLNPKYTEVGTAVLNGFGENNAIIAVQLFADKKIVEQGPNLQVLKSDNSTVNPSEQPSRMLSEEKYPIILGVKEPFVENDIYLKSLSYILYNSEQLLEKVIYGMSLILIGFFLTAILLDAQSVSKKFIFKSLLILIVLSLAYIIKRQDVMLMMPHKIII